MGYDRLDHHSADALEREVLHRWRDEDLFHQTLAATQGGDSFVFYEGPPTANGKPGIHHVFARTIKDLICRFQTMRGRRVTRIAGWDTHGLPVEIEVEKQLALSGKDDIEEFGVAEFNSRCRESVFKYRSDWESLSERIGYWLDYDAAYVTYTNDYIESVWWILKRLYDKDMLYLGYKVLPYCIRCGTVLSSHELALGYADHKSPSIYALIRLAEESVERYLLVWTTTPWTLPSNVAVAVNPSFTYVELDVAGRRIIVEESIAARLAVPGATGGKVLADFDRVGSLAGSELVGRRYEQLVDAIQVDGTKAFRVVAGDFVTQDEGTGLVHIAPAYGADDYAVVQREDLAFFIAVDDAGRFQDTAWDELNGRTVFESNAIIARRLEREGKLFGRYDPKGYEHTYPFCWRCDSPLIYYARESWFVRTTKVKQRLVELNAGIGWNPPEVGTGRFGEWLENNIDWALSRDRYWGTPLPVWVCGDDPSHVSVVGSYAELSECLGGPLPDGFDPHKPFIDDIEFPCSECGAAMKRVPQVIDAWFDSGSMPFAQWHYPFENNNAFENHFPADFICEGIDQTRGWFYSLLAIATAVVDETAYRNVIVNELVLDAQGRKMSKRLGNSVDPWDPIEKYGADAVRLYLLAASQVWLPKRFDPKAISEVSLAFLNRLRNTYGFFALYAEDWDPTHAVDPKDLQPIDAWLLGQLDRLTERVTEHWCHYDVTAGVRALIDFCDNDLSNWYVRINRTRFWAPDSKADPAALTALHETLTTVCRLLAPAAPFMADAIHRNLTGTSVHLASFPRSGHRTVEALERAVDAVRRFASLARAARESAGLRVRQPLQTLKVAMPASIEREYFDRFVQLLKHEVNVKQVDLVGSDEQLVTLRGKPNFRTLGKVYGKGTPQAAEAVSHLSSDQLRELENGATVMLQWAGAEFAYRPEDVVVQPKVNTDWPVQADGPFVAAIDPDVTENLKLEGIARELINRIQRFRREAGYDYTTRIQLGILGPQEIQRAASEYRDFIAGETLAKRFELGEIADPDLRQTTDLNGVDVIVSLKRQGAESISEG
ncbi:MAG: isoleucine--tRNA ligase [Gemmatimonadales bacterium]